MKLLYQINVYLFIYYKFI